MLATARGPIVAPTGTPKDIIANINANIVSVLKLPDVCSAYAAQGTTDWKQSDRVSLRSSTPRPPNGPRG